MSDFLFVFLFCISYIGFWILFFAFVVAFFVIPSFL